MLLTARSFFSLCLKSGVQALCGFTLLVITMASQAAEGEALSALLKKLQGMENFQASFVQTSKSQNGAEQKQQIQGTLSVAKPGKMRWETADPYAQLVVSDGKLLWIYDMDIENVTIRNMDQRVQETPALLLSGNVAEIDKSFVVSHEGSNSNPIFQLVPKDSSQLFESLEFHYQGELLSRMMIVDASGSITEIAFSDQQLNHEIDSHAFVFDVPEGVDVIDGRQGF